MIDFNKKQEVPAILKLEWVEKKKPAIAGTFKNLILPPGSLLMLDKFS